MPHVGFWSPLPPQGSGIADYSFALLSELAKKFDIHPNLITQWKTLLLENAVSAFDGNNVKTEEVDVEKLHAKIGQLTLENDFLEKALGRVGGPSARR